MEYCFRNFRTALDFLTATSSPGALMEEILKLQEIYLLHTGKICLSSFSRLSSPSSQPLSLDAPALYHLHGPLLNLLLCPWLFCVEEFISRHWAVTPVIIRRKERKGKESIGRKIEQKLQSNFSKWSCHPQKQYNQSCCFKCWKTYTQVTFRKCVINVGGLGRNQCRPEIYFRYFGYFCSRNFL